MVQKVLIAMIASTVSDKVSCSKILCPRLFYSGSESKIQDNLVMKAVKVMIVLE